MMTWIEGFSYAITPLMAFTVLLGARGIHITGQYFLMLLWIQLWMPILAVINLYITMSAGGDLAALDAAQFNLPSMYGLYRMDLEIQNWLAVGGMLASSTPAIALMLVYGGSITATHFLGRMQGGDFVDEKITSPAVVSPAPVLNLQPLHQHAPLTGTTLYGADRVLPTFQAGSDLSASVSSAFGAMRQATHTFMESLSNVSSRSSSLSQEGFDAHTLANRIASSRNQTDKFLQATGEDFAQRYRDSGISGDDFAAVVGGAAGLPKDLLPLAISGQLQNQFHVSKSRADEIASDITERVTEDHGWQTDLARSVATDAQSGTREVASLGLQRQDLSSLQKSASDTISASESYHQTVSAQRRFGASASYGAAETGLKLAASSASMALLDTALDRFGLRGDAQRLGAEWRSSGLIVDQEQAYAAAGMALLNGYASPVFRKLSENEARLAEAAGYQILGDVWHAPKPENDLRPDGNFGLTNQAPDFGAVHSKVESGGFHDPRGETGGLEGHAQSRIRSVSGQIADGENQVIAAYGAGQTEMEREAIAGFGTMHANKASHLRDEISKAANTQGSAAEIEYDAIGGAIYSIAQNIGGLGELGKGTASKFVSAFQSSLEQGKGYGQAFMDAARAVPEEAKKAVGAWADARVNEIGGRLTSEQRAFYRAALFESFAGVSLRADFNPMLGIPVSSAMSETRRQLIESEGEAGNDIADLLQRAAGQNRGDLVDLIGAYNLAKKPSQ
jgi:conjugal transfer mating pair stabilization protein TraG